MSDAFHSTAEGVPPTGQDDSWPYGPEEGQQISGPTWDCPGGTCTCHPPQGAPTERRKHVIVMHDPLGNRLPGARCRVFEHGRQITPNGECANAVGEITVEILPTTFTLRVEWVPPTLPRRARLPYRRLYHVRLGKDLATATDRRLSNLGFCRRRRQDNVRDYQRAYAQDESGDARDIQGELALRHDRGMLPAFVVRPTAGPQSDADAPVAAFFASPARLAPVFGIVVVSATSTEPAGPLEDSPAVPEPPGPTDEQNMQGAIGPGAASAWGMVSLESGLGPLSLANIRLRLRPLNVAGLSAGHHHAEMEPDAPGVFWDPGARTHAVFAFLDVPAGRYAAIAHILDVDGTSGDFAVGSAELEVRTGLLALAHIPSYLGTPGAAAPPIPLTVWAAGIKTPLRFADNDARLPSPGGGDQTFGQDGWKVGVEFKDFAHLGALLADGKLFLPSFVCDNVFEDCGPVEESQIHRLAILAHGGPGGVDIDGKAGVDQDSGVATDPSLLNITTLAKYSKQFKQILTALAPRARVFFMSCLTGAATEGDEFLKAVSRVWMSKDVHVIGFKSVLYCDGARQKKRGKQGSCYPGARETHYSNNKPPGTNITRPHETLAVWNDLKVLPWASEKTVHASIAYWGTLLKTGVVANPWGLDPSAPPSPSP